MVTTLLMKRNKAILGYKLFLFCFSFLGNMDKNRYKLVIKGRARGDFLTTRRNTRHPDPEDVNNNSHHGVSPPFVLLHMEPNFYVYVFFCCLFISFFSSFWVNLQQRLHIHNTDIHAHAHTYMYPHIRQFMHTYGRTHTCLCLYLPMPCCSKPE